MDFISSGTRKRFQTFAWLLLAYNILVILWGAFVRISFSGDGCGANWPFCNGQMIPQHMAAPTAIEYTHRLMTSLDSFGTIALCIWAFLSFPAKHAVRRYSLFSLLFLFIEALLGAGLVLLRLVAKDQSAGRAVYLSAHLTNTLLLLAAVTVTAWLPGANIVRMRWRNASRKVLSALAVAVLVSVTGVIAALGDTLFPASSLAAGMQQDFSRAASLLLRLRLFHPVIAVIGALYVVWVASQLLRKADIGRVRSAAIRVIALTILQLAAGAINLTLLAPVWMQLFHLLIADLLWISLVVLLLDATCPVLPESSGNSAREEEARSTRQPAEAPSL
jgi:heme A synthase